MDILTEFEKKLNEKGLHLPQFIKTEVSVSEHPAKSLICTAGDAVHKIQILVKGELIILNSFSDGKEFVFTSENDFTLLGDLEFFSGHMTNASSVLTNTDVVLVGIELRMFTRWINMDRKFYDFVVRQLANKCYKGASVQGNIKYKNAASRVVKTLLDISVPFKRNSEMLVAECSHYEIARMAGMSERTVNRVFQELQKRELISIEYRKVCIAKKDIGTLMQMM
ncbi:Crp/Fnr family transcriptional regulator [Lactonifactor longoviformis]|uniref:cAMP-binding domain of CRP or a regulatory subunit of cAMP-dependent protein kinases n=1 Tax=Lactonifactor longoviformis DSM 17459 TaxID=1122155 RepID=A0A1M5BCY4_9CLOT|nr:Crp/Fnr family transcriptional regulator [Lactonifactor longoviformis]POP33355.1 Crp/Fnr family transcriptional regulator [Lactonifactor longoviformis]SHF40349.1 cAMP-binding domain of CRP or a regulatory subunit of cAMP-dependent protein kinases [Lactonifactor longoviformis DSM 17459]